MKKFKRIFLVVIDSLGIGEDKKSKEYGDAGADTLGHICQSVDTLKIPSLQRLGIANLKKLQNVEPVESPLGYYTSLNEASVGKDTLTGHWEMMGIKVEIPFKSFEAKGFPKELLDELSARTGKTIIGNKSASGTEILDELALQEINEGNMIVYTSADSVLQICGNEETFGLAKLYKCCEIARELTMKEEWKVGRVIARPYIGSKPGEFKRTSNRRDYALEPSYKMVLDTLKENNFDVISVGKINDIFANRGITKALKSHSSVHGMEQTIEMTKEEFTGLCFVNLVDFDALWGHRRDAVGYARELEKFDEKLSVLLEELREDDLLILTADHGTDPTFKGTDHTREKVPFIAYSKRLAGGGKLEEQETFGVIGATISQNFGVPMAKDNIGISILDKIL